MSYFPRRTLGALGATGSTCGADQVFDPNVTFNGIKGQCVPKSQSSSKFRSRAEWEASQKSTASSIFDAFIGALTPAPAVAAPAVIAPAHAGMSTGTKVAIAGGALVLVALIATR